jgi:DNA-directed RNA polymerase subunit RPC12/RpoP
MGASGENYVCLSCHREFPEIEEVKKSFLGFEKWTCPHCQNKNLYPLTTSYVVIYVLILAGTALASIAAMTRGEMPMPGLVAIAAVIGLVKNGQIKAEVRQAEEICAEGLFGDDDELQAQ